MMRNEKKIKRALTVLIFAVSLLVGSKSITVPVKEELMEGSNAITNDSSIPVAGITETINNIMNESKEASLQANNNYLVATSYINFINENGKVIDVLEIDDGKEDDTFYDCELSGYYTGNVNIREEANTDSKILGTGYFNDELSYAIYNDDWVVIEYPETETGYAYISREYTDNNKVSCKASYDVSGDTRKSYMSYKAITSRGSKQYKLEQEAYTGNYGVRQHNDRYLIAIGSYYGASIGQYIDVILENGEVIECIVGDAKQKRHTSNGEMLGLDGGAVEFIVDTSSIDSDCKRSGSMSDACNLWNSNVVEIQVYDKTAL